MVMAMMVVVVVMAVPVVMMVVVMMVMVMIVPLRLEHSGEPGAHADSKQRVNERSSQQECACDLQQQ